MPISSRQALLSFDDGPAPTGALQSILKTLKTAKIKAEFYMLGEEIKRHPALVLRTAEEGHKIQNHSWSHVDLSTASLGKVRQELTDTQEIIQTTTGQTPTRVRPPYGNGGWPGQVDPELESVAASLSLEIKNWDIDTRDWEAPRGLGKTQSIRRQLVTANSSPVNILMHVQPETATDLPKFIEQLQKWRYEFATP